MNPPLMLFSWLVGFIIITLIRFWGTAERLIPVRVRNLFYAAWYAVLPQWMVAESGGRVEAIMVYPVKSLGPVYLERCTVDEFGFEHDRMFMLGRWSVKKGAFESVTQRQCPRLALCTVRLTPQAVVVSWPPKGVVSRSSNGLVSRPAEGGSFNIPMGTAPDSAPVELWGVEFKGRVLDLLPLRFLEEMGLPVDTKLLATKAGKEVKSNSPGALALFGTEAVTSAFRSTRFQEYFPSLFLTTEDIENLNHRLKGRADRLQASERNFRGNVLLSGTRQPFDSDTWCRVVIGGHEWIFTSKCPRCSIPNVNPLTGERYPGAPISDLLARFRRIDSGQKAYFFFGMHAIQVGRVGYEMRVGDLVTVLTRKVNVYAPLTFSPDLALIAVRVGAARSIGMDLLCDYTSSSSSASNSDSDSESLPPKRKLPPVAPALLDKFAKSPRISVSDTPAMNKGNIRSALHPHVSLMWHGFCFLEWSPTRAQASRLLPLAQRLTTALCRQSNRFAPNDWQSNVVSPLGSSQPLHVSLSETLCLQAHQPAEFLSHVRAGLRNVKLTPTQTENANEVRVRFEPTPRVYTNQLGSKLFLALALDPSSAARLLPVADIIDTEVKRLLEVNNDPLLAPLKRSYHVSLAYCLADPPVSLAELERLNERLSSLSSPTKGDAALSLALDELLWTTRVVKFQTGREFHSLDIGKVLYLDF